MTEAWRRHFAGLHLAALLVWALVACAGAAWLASARLAHLHAAFETDARIVHRLLSQRVVQHDAVMSMLALLQPPAAQGAAPAADATATSTSTSAAAVAPAATLPRLPSVYPQILSVLQRPADGAWPAALQAPLAAAEAASRTTGRPEMALADLPAACRTVLHAR